MVEPVVTRDISLDVEPSLRLTLHAQGSNLSTYSRVSRSNKTNALSEGNNEDRQVSTRNGHGVVKGLEIQMGIVAEDGNDNDDQDDGGLDELDENDVSHEKMKRSCDMVGMNAIGDDALDDTTPLRMNSNNCDYRL